MDSRTEHEEGISSKKYSAIGALLGALVGLVTFYFVKDTPGANWNAVLYIGLFVGVSGGLILGGLVGALNDMRLRSNSA